jgi:hypothetical protein
MSRIFQAVMRMVPNTGPPVSDSPYQESAGQITIALTHFIIFSEVPAPLPRRLLPRRSS